MGILLSLNCENVRYRTTLSGKVLPAKIDLIASLAYGIAAGKEVKDTIIFFLF